jgi:predicted transcriptional regulator
LLRPTVNIPAREAWIYEDSSVLDTVRKGLREAKEGKVTKVENIEKFIEKL